MTRDEEQVLLFDPQTRSGTSISSDNRIPSIEHRSAHLQQGSSTTGRNLIDHISYSENANA